MGDIHESFYGTRVFHHALLQISDIEYHNFFEKNHRSIRFDYKLCVDILKMCIKKFGIIFSNDIWCIQCAFFSE